MLTWNMLDDHDKAQVVAFLRTAEDEGLGYAWEHYPPKFSHALADVEYPQAVRNAYGQNYRALNYGDEFWRLYELGTADPR